MKKTLEQINDEIYNRMIQSYGRSFDHSIIPIFGKKDIEYYIIKIKEREDFVLSAKFTKSEIRDIRINELLS